VELVLGLAAAVLASLLFNVGVVLQALEARREPPELALRIELLLVLLRRWRWTLGLLLGLVGVAPQVLALATAPFVVVQPALTVGLLVVLATGVRTLGERVGIQVWLGVVAIIGGIALIASGAPGHVETHRGGFIVVAVVAAPCAVALVPFLVRGTRLDGGGLAMIAAGAGFAAANIATKLMSDDVGLRHWSNAVAWAAIGLGAGIAATITGMTAFQRAPATVVVPVTTAIQTFLPIVLEPLFLREQWSSTSLDGLVLATGFVVALSGTVVVARAPAVGEVVATAARGS
jgi:drug/metabolite transporter (DMT)-like permease